MLDTLKHAGKNIGRELSRSWKSLSEGWHELLSHSSNALTCFSRSNKHQAQPGDGALATFPPWSPLSGEVEETDAEIMVRVELPGMEKEDFRITIESNLPSLGGGKNFEHETGDSAFHVTERAHGAYQRTILLPRHVDAGNAGSELQKRSVGYPPAKGG